MDSNDTRRRARHSMMQMRRIKDLTMSIIILAMAFLMFFGEKITALAPFMADKDPLMKSIFGGLCLLYGGFRAYRAIKGSDYQ